MRTITKQICIEDLISRLPALFAYMEADDTGVFHLHKSTDALQGCWGKIVSDINIEVPDNDGAVLAEFYIRDGVLIRNDEYVALDDAEKDEYSLYDKKVYQKNDISEIITEEIYEAEGTNKADYNEIINVIVENGKIYSYRTLMNFYYKYKSDYTQQPFFTFMDYYIGLVDVTVEQTEERDLMPGKVYMADIRRLFPIYRQYKVIYDQYKNDYTDFKKQKNLDQSICCAIKTYIRMGGDDMYDFLSGLFGEMNKRADEAYEMAVGEAQSSVLINLNQSQNDIGYLSCYLNDWIPGEPHKMGELYTYEGNTYICNVDNTDWFDVRIGELVFFKPDYKEGDEHFTRMSEAVKNRTITSSDPNGGKKKEEPFFIMSKSDSKLNGLRRYTKYINGIGEFEEVPYGENWLYFFRTNIAINLSFIRDDDGNIADIDIYESSGERVAATDDTSLAVYGDVIESITRDVNNKTITFVYYIGAHLTATMKTSESPIIWSDFKYYNGGVRYTETYSYDEGGEIDKMLEFHYYSLKYGESSDYGTPITEEVYSELPSDEKTKYEVAVYQLKEGQVSDYGTMIGETVWAAISANEKEKYEKMLPVFSEYIKGENANDYKFDFHKYAFTVNGNMSRTSVYTNRGNLTWDYVSTDSRTEDDGTVDYMYTDIIKNDYLMGITYKPEVETAVFIDRGNYSAFERHIALSQVKTIEDLETYRNGGFFNMQNVNG